MSDRTIAYPLSDSEISRSVLLQDKPCIICSAIISIDRLTIYSIGVVSVRGSINAVW